MEKESKTTRFCLVCNYVSRIIEPITSRCTKFRFKSLGAEKIVERLKLICLEEGVQVEDSVYRSIVEISDGDMRRAITSLQSCYRLRGGQGMVTARDISEISGIVPNHFLEEYLAVCQRGDYGKLETFVQKMGFEAYSVAQLFEQFNEFVINHSDLSNKQKAIICDKLGECCFRMQEGGSEYLQIMDLGCVIIKSIKG